MNSVKLKTRAWNVAFKVQAPPNFLASMCSFTCKRKSTNYHWGTNSTFSGLIFFGISEASVAAFQTKDKREKEI